MKYQEDNDDNFDAITFDLAGIERQYDRLSHALPGVDIRFAIKACPVDGVLRSLVEKGSGFDAAGVNEILQAIKSGCDVSKIHYGNTIKSDKDISHAYYLNIRDFVTDNIGDVQAIARLASGSRICCRIANEGKGALWELSRKFGCSGKEAVQVLIEAKRSGLKPAGLSAHVGSQQMEVAAWEQLFTLWREVLLNLKSKGIQLEYINLGGGFPCSGYLDKQGNKLSPPEEKIFSTIRENMSRLQKDIGYSLRFIAEPGRYIVADSGMIRAHVVRLSERIQPCGTRERWLYLSCGVFNGLFETDKIRYKMRFPKRKDSKLVPAIVAGPTCDSYDVINDETSQILVPEDLQSGDPVLILSCGAYSASFATVGFNGFSPLKHSLQNGSEHGSMQANLIEQPALS
ncbi:type III PLP-dependent enzyme [Vibrio sp. ZSDZ65]|uniref:ornithine decarboxylase n=1 Tax=Vibrio qingdaonensis TaxID=2829491 RepID=A0A9X3CLD1_9VIBR|nr:type III PLP-dependent enzyme [Vibrio qingdaonensis]MCW8345582.1 type III PLP-dependent enzyme [Vibrio qingdaonensis]